MSLKFIFGLSGSGKTARCCKEIFEYTQNKDSSAYFIVPDQSTYTTEYILAKTFPEGGFTNVTVTGFSRLAYKIFREVKTRKHDAISKLGQDLVLSLILSEEKNNLSVLSQMSSQPKFIKSLKDIFHQFNSSLITEEMLENAAKKEKDSHLGKKLRDLHLLFKKYHEYLTNRFSYNGEIFDLLATEIYKSDSIKKSAIWIDGYHGFTLQEMKIISALVKNAKKVTITLPFESAEQAMQNPLFMKPSETWRILSENEKASDATILTTLHRFQSSRIRSLVKYGFETTPYECREKEETDGGIYPSSAADRSVEVDFIARKILTLVRDKKLRYRDITVLLRNPELYTDLIERIFKKYELPVFINKKDTMNNHPLIVSVTGLLEFLTAQANRKNSGYSRHILFPILKTGLLKNFPPEKVNKLENYIIKNGIRFFQWDKEWNYRTVKDIDNPENELSEIEKSENEKANSCRKQLLETLGNLEKEWNTNTSVKERCRILYEWLVSQNIPQILAERDKIEFEKTQKKPHIQAWKKFISLLDELVNIAGEDTLPEEYFMNVLKSGLFNLSFATIPDTLDHITATSISRGYHMESAAVFIPGMANGEFPKDIENTNFITEAERKHLAKENTLTLGNDFVFNIYEEQFYTYLALTRAKKYMYISYPKTDSENKPLEPSFIYKKIISLNYAHAEEIADRPTYDTKDMTFFSNPKQAITLLPEILRQGIPEKNSFWTYLKNWATQSHNEYAELFYDQQKSFKYNSTASTLSQDIVNKLFKPYGKFYGSISQLEEYRSCPYKYFLNRGLKLSDRQDGRIQNIDFGNYLHSGLKRFGNLLSSMNKTWKDLSDDEIDAFSNQISSIITPLVAHGTLTSDATNAYTHRLLNMTFKKSIKQFKNWSENSDFKTTDLEREFKINIKADDKDTFTLRGKIDRIDSYTTETSQCALAVCDYKTGIQSIDLQSIISGIKLQLVTYMLAMIKENPEKNIIPTALMYIYLSNDAENFKNVPPDGIPAKEETSACDGFYLSDANLLTKLDKYIEDKNSKTKKHINVTLNKNGTLRANKNTLTPQEMENLTKAVEQKLIDLYKQISQGNISISPTLYDTHTACDYCPYKSICRFDIALKNKYNFVNKLNNNEVKEILNEKGNDK